MSSDIEQFLSGYPADIGHIANELRALIGVAAPGCTETLHAGWKVISYSYRTQFCAIAPHGSWVNLQFHAGASLDDAHRLLTGTGKAMRHVKVSDLSALNENLASLVGQASSRAA